MTPQSMVTEQARVVEPGGGGAWVELAAAGGCRQCSARHGCGNALLARWGGARSRRLWVQCDQPLQRGDRITVALPASRFLGGTAMLYGLPLMVALLLGGLAEWLAGAGHALVPLAFLGGLVLGWGGTKAFALRYGARFALQASVVENR